MCGSPIFDYEHIYGYGVTGDQADAITLLCAFHHREKTSGRLPVTEVELANDEPWNLRRKYSAKHPLYFSEMVAIQLGNVRAESDGTSRRQGFGVSVDGRFLIGAVMNPGLELNLDLRDADNRVMLLVNRGELMISNRLWDVTFEGRRLVVRDGFRSVVLDLELNPPHELIVHRADVWLQHAHVLIGAAAPSGGFDASGIVITQFLVQGGVIAIGEGAPAHAMFSLKPKRGYGAPAVPGSSAFRRR
jgi:hypothetical protein